MKSVTNQKGFPVNNTQKSSINDNEISFEDDLITKSAPSAIFTQRIVNVDYYSAIPTNEFDPVFSECGNKDVYRVPVLRIFGSTPKGQKTCAHIHGVFPYITILNNPSIRDLDKIIAKEINESLNSSITSNFKNNKTCVEHVFKVVKVNGRTFYGYRHSEETFLRLYFYNPFVIKKAVDLLVSGSVLKTQFQPYEAHIPYQLQFMIDFNLYGMNLVNYSLIKFRRQPGKNNNGRISPVSSLSNASLTSSSGVATYWNLSQLSDSLFSSTSLEKTTTCELEIDVLASDIIVQNLNYGVRSCNPGIDAIWRDEKERRKQHKQEDWSQITIPTSQSRVYCGELFPTEESYREILLKKIRASKNGNIQSQSSSTLSDDTFPSSQLITHQPHSGASNSKIPKESEDEELLRLFYELQQEKEREEKFLLEAEGARLNTLGDVDPLLDDQEDEILLPDFENQWEQSFLSNTMIEEMFLEPEEKTKEEDSLKHVDEDLQTKTIFQGDGQGGESDSDKSDSKTLEVKPYRRSSRRCVSKQSEEEKTASSSKSNADKSAISQSQPESLKSTSRLSLANRRKSYGSQGISQTSLQEKIIKSTTTLASTNSDTDKSADKSAENKTLSQDKKTSSNKETPSKRELVASRSSVRLSSRSSTSTTITSNTSIKKKNTASSQIQSNDKQIPITEQSEITFDKSSITKQKVMKKIQNLFDPVVELKKCDDLLTQTPKKIPSNTAELTNSNKSLVVVLPEQQPIIKKRGRPRKVSSVDVDNKSFVAENTSNAVDCESSTISDLPSTSQSLQKPIDEESLQNLEISSSKAPAKVVKIRDSRNQKRKVIATDSIKEMSTNKTEDTKNKVIEEVVVKDETLSEEAKQIKEVERLVGVLENLISQEEENEQEEEDIVMESLSTLSPPSEIKDKENDDHHQLKSSEVKLVKLVDSSCQTDDLPWMILKETDEKSTATITVTTVEISIQTDEMPEPVCVDCQSTKSADKELLEIGNMSSDLFQDESIKNSIANDDSNIIMDTIERDIKNSKKINEQSPETNVKKVALIPSLGLEKRKSPSKVNNKSPIKINSSPVKKNPLIRRRSPTKKSPIKMLGRRSTSPKKKNLSVKSIGEKYSTSYKTFFKKMLTKNAKSNTRRESESVKDDLSVNSIYEYSSPQINQPLSSTPKNNIIKDDSSVRLFDIKRSASRSKARKRRLKIISGALVVNFAASDVFEHEFEPMKQPPAYRYVIGFKNKKPDKVETNSSKKEQYDVDSGNISSQEDSPEKVRRCNLKSSSDSDEDEQASFSNSFSRKENISQVHSVNFRTPTNGTIPNSDTPRSILRCSARQRGLSAKRKIRWEDDGKGVLSKKSKILTKPLVGVEKPPEIPTSHSSEDHYSSNKSAIINMSELDGLSPKNRFGFEHDMSNLQDAKALHQHQHLTVMSAEVLCQVRGDLLPDPKFDKVDGIFVFISNDVPESFDKPKQVLKCFLVNNVQKPFSDGENEYFSNEKELFDGFLNFYHEWDPDILVGYETEKLSWGYIIARGSILGLDMTQLLSRILKKKNNFKDNSQLTWDGMLCGRIVLNLWRLLRHEITVQSYTYENAAYHVLHRKVYKFSHKMLAEFWSDARNRWRVLEYYAERVTGVIELINTLDMINRTSELARLFGIQFYEVFSRGSQFRVESMMLRATKPLNLIAVSPSIVQRSKMRAPEFLPLILEPKSSYYTDPVAVLDFQSLYPSMIIAYNYDYSTVLGRVEHLGTDSPFELGCLENEVSTYTLNLLKDHIHISPAGVAFVDASVKKGVLPEMLEQILDTRQMVKRAMKKWKSEGATIQKILDSRQLGLKLIANVTYGYTSANFSGRMPCVDIADSVVSKGRETLHRAIELVKSNYDRWGGEVIYGDTDSMFIQFKQKDRVEAFRLAQEIADEVTQSNPKPVKLKLEKIYQPCILQSKKRYVGYSYETADQEQPTYDAKGIETVRRDGCPAVKKILEKSLHILFTTNDAEKVKTFVQMQFKKLFTGRVSMREYTFAREFRGRDGYKPKACVPSLEIAKRVTERDPRAEPLTQERVPYVIIYDKPTLPLIQMVRTPMEFVNDYSLRLNAHYYIEKAIIPALNRCFAHAKIDVSKWYKSLPRKYLRNVFEDNNSVHVSLDEFINHRNCFRCDQMTEKHICEECSKDLRQTSTFLVQKSSDLARKLETSRQICESCSSDDDKCCNTDCAVFHKLLRYERDEHYNRQLLLKLKDIEF